MPTLSSNPAPSDPAAPPGARSTDPAAPHEARRMAESFGVAAECYDRARPSYPDELVARILRGSPGRDVLDVGCGTGIAARQFQAAGCRVLGIEPDPRMADVARRRGLAVEVSRFETWPPRGRSVDVVIAAQSWHWIDPATGPSKAAHVLRDKGRLAVVGHVFEPPAAVGDSFAAAYRRLVPGSPFGAQPDRSVRTTYQAMYLRFADNIRQTGLFDEPEQWSFDWVRTYRRDEWLSLLPTTGPLTALEPDTTAKVLAAVGRTIDTLGGEFTMSYTTLATTATRATPAQ